MEKKADFPQREGRRDITEIWGITVYIHRQSLQEDIHIVALSFAHEKCHK